MSLIDNLPKIYLKPGEMAVCDYPAEVTTVLGSCVALALFSLPHRLGALCHAMLPYGHHRRDASNAELFRYVDTSLYYMLDYFARRRIDKREIQIKLFGGADMFDAKIAARTGTVGHQNLKAAHEVLRHKGLTLVAEDVGGCSGRKILFYPHTGDVYLKRLGKQNG